jgi:hypothetical protein
MSVPQIVVAVILITASPAAALGRGTCSSDTCPLPENTIAFMVCMTFERCTGRAEPRFGTSGQALIVDRHCQPESRTHLAA